MKKAIIVILVLVLIIGGVILISRDGNRIITKLSSRGSSPVVVTAGAQKGARKAQNQNRKMQKAARKPGVGGPVVVDADGKPRIGFSMQEDGDLKVLAASDSDRLKIRYRITKPKSGDGMLVWDIQNKRAAARIRSVENGFIVVKKVGDDYLRYRVSVDEEKGRVFVRQVGEPEEVWKVLSAKKEGLFLIRSGRENDNFGAVRIHADKSLAVLRGEDGDVQYRVRDAESRKAYGALLFDLPDEDRELIAAELYRRKI